MTIRDSDELDALISNVHDPRALAVLLERAEEELARMKHPDPYIRESVCLDFRVVLVLTIATVSAPLFPGGTKW